MILGERIVERLKALDIGQTELARRVGISQPSINYLIKKGGSGSSHLHKIARALATTPAYLMGETDDPQSDAVEVPLTSEERDMVDLMRNLRPADRGALMHLARTIATSAASPLKHEGAKHKDHDTEQ
jgi:transcriptional regulator with XRE-family HTH domain